MNQNNDNDNDDNMKKCFISIQGMSCSSCVDKIENKLKKTDGIISCQIGLITSQAEIDYNPNIIKNEKIIDILDDMGYDVKLISIIDRKNTQQQTELLLDIMGITNNDDIRLIETTIKQKLIGISSITINRDTGRTRIIYYSNIIGPRKIADNITELGFTVHTINSFNPETFTETIKNEINKWRQSFLISLIFGIPTIIVMIYFMYILPFINRNDDDNHHQKNCCLIPGLSLENLLLFCLATPVQIFGARCFYIQAFKSIRNGYLNMDVLIMLATTISYLYSIGVLLYFILTNQQQSPMTFFDTPPMLLVFISLGRWLEHINRLRTTEYIVNLMSLRPLKATLLEFDDDNDNDKDKIKKLKNNEFRIKNERIIDIDLVEKGDYLRVRSGERIPTDGRMIIGEALIDESFINGESMPVLKKPGSILFGGSIVSNGIVLMIATNVGTDSQLCQIVKMVENAQTTKAPIQKLADRISSYFIPFVIIISLIAFIIWLYIGENFYDYIYRLNPEFYSHMTKTEIIIQFSFQISLSVLIISCPCALGIATPSAVIIGTGIGAINGIHIKGAEPLERANNLDTIIFDKTGTLTLGKPSITNIKLTYYIPSSNENDNKLFKFIKKLIILIGIAESNCDHPIAISMINYAKKFLHMNDDQNFIQTTTINSNNSDDNKNENSENNKNKFKLESGLGISCIIDSYTLNQFELSLLNSTSATSSSMNNNNKWLAENYISYSSYLLLNDNEIKNKYLLDDNFFNNNQQQHYNILIGNIRWMKKCKIFVENEIENEYNKLEYDGETVFMIAINKKILCLISVNDTIKEESLLTIYSLKKLFNLNIILLTGDNIRSAISIGRKIGIKHIYAELLPKHKMDKIKQLQSIGKKVAMIGDGINDAPALAQSNLGIAIAKGTDITMESADVVLTKDDLLDIVSCIDLSKKTMQRIRINFLLAFIYNVIFIPIAAGIFIKFSLILQPWMSGACMAFSSISVSCSSLLLRRYRKPTRQQLETDDYYRYKSRLKLQNHGVTFATTATATTKKRVSSSTLISTSAASTNLSSSSSSTSSSTSSSLIMDLDQLSLHNSYNLIGNGVKKVDQLYRPKFMDNSLSNFNQNNQNNDDDDDNNSSTSNDENINQNNDNDNDHEKVRLIRMKNNAVITPTTTMDNKNDNKIPSTIIKNSSPLLSSSSSFKNKMNNNKDSIV